MAHKFNVTPAANDQFKFDFSYNSEKIFWSENYKQKASAKSAIESLKKNAPGAATVDLSKGETGSGYRFEIVASKDGQHFVRFVAGNGETMVRTETYTSKASAKNAIESLQKNGPGADVADDDNDDDELDPLSNTKVMLRTYPSQISDQMRSISMAAKEKLEAIQLERPNSTESTNQKGRAVEFLKELSDRSDAVADNIESPDGDVHSQAALIKSLSQFVSRWISENADLIKKFKIIGMIGLSCAILNFLGCTPEISSVTSTFLFGGKALADYVASALDHNKKQK